MKRSLAILMLLTALGCGEPTTDEEYLEFWEGMYMEAARDVNTARTLEDRNEAYIRMGRYEYEMNKAHNATIEGSPYDHPMYITIYGDDS